MEDIIADSLHPLAQGNLKLEMAPELVLLHMYTHMPASPKTFVERLVTKKTSKSCLIYSCSKKLFKRVPCS